MTLWIDTAGELGDPIPKPQGRRLQLAQAWALGRRWQGRACGRGAAAGQARDRHGEDDDGACARGQGDAAVGC